MPNHGIFAILTALINNHFYMKYTPKTFTIPPLIGISEQTIKEHIGLYEGYVKNTNLILDTLQQGENHTPYALSEMQRRLGFEFNGMRNHELYFGALEHGPVAISQGPLYQAIEATWGSFDAWMTQFKTLAKTRGIGWAMLYHDTKNNTLIHTWVDEQHLGQLAGCTPILALDMWEHSFVADYQPSGKATYIDDFFANLNWSYIEAQFSTNTQ